MGTFKLNPNFARELQPLVVTKMEPIAEAVLQRAITTAHVEVVGKHPGAYKASLRKERGKYGWRISANVSYAQYVEFGTSKMKAIRTLGRALDAAREKR